MATGRGARVLGAVAVALLLLSGTGATYAGWTDTTEVGRDTTVTSGALRTERVQGDVSVRRGGATLPASEPLLPGDVVEITTSVRLTVRGVAGELTLDAAPAADALAAEDVTLGTPSIAVAGLAPGPAAASSVTWRGRVTEADDGAFVTATVRLPLRTDLTPAAQGRRIDLTAAPVTWDLTQESTPAGWHDGESEPLQPLTTDQVGLTVTRTGAGTATVTSTSRAAALTWAPTSVSAAPVGATTAAEATGVLSGLAIGYGTDCSAAPRWQAQAGGTTRPVTGTGAPLAAGASSGLCARVTPTNSTTLTRTYGARTVALTTAVTAVADAAATWTATGAAQATFQVAFPQPTGLTCTSGSTTLLLFETPARLTWSWAGSTTTEPAVALWELVRQSGNGSWQTVHQQTDGTLRAELKGSDLPSNGAARTFKVRAYPFSVAGSVDRSLYVESDTVVALRRSSSGAAVCDGSPQPNTAAKPIPGGLS
jgi:hypothetical protein